MEWTVNQQKGELLLKEQYFSEEVQKEVIHYHKIFPQYKPTDLVILHNLADKLQVKDIYIKEESSRFQLGSFKVLGGSYAMGKILAEHLGKEITTLTYQDIIGSNLKEKERNLTFITATDGNHGKGVAWTAAVMKSLTYVLMPKGSSRERLENILKMGAKAWITDKNYDDTVRLASHIAKENGYILVQDTAWEGYKEIPLWIMQGYSTMVSECIKQMPQKPTHIFLQAGVGSMAAAVAGCFRQIYQEKCPRIIIVEAQAADCFYQTIKRQDGHLFKVEGELSTIMAGLACGEPSILAYSILEKDADVFLSCEDFVAANGVRILSNPIEGDQKILAGESGAAGLGALTEILRRPCNRELKREIGLNEDSVVLVFNTEGVTDKCSYRQIVWDGRYSNTVLK